MEGFKILAVLFVFLGELLAIYSETFSTKHDYFTFGFWKLLLIMSAGGFLLILGYLMGFRAFGNLWVITVVSITTLLIAEPLVITIFLKQIPTLGAMIGFILGIFGLVAALFI